MPAGTGTRPEPYEGAGEAEARHAYAQHSPGHAQASGQPINFDTLVFSLASQAMIFLGDVADDEGKRHTDPALARQMIDLLGILREKTRGNLSPDEDRFLGDTLRDLRLHFVAVTGAKGQT
ncbi:DUF1844 domain-containing protein [bacterium]|nr:DUF1844 domain-containing protein [bacterium]